MAYVKIGFDDRVDTNPDSYLIIRDSGNELVRIQKENSGVSVFGTPLNHENLDHVEEGILAVSLIADENLEEVIDHEKRILFLELVNDLNDLTEGIPITNGFRETNDLTDPNTFTLVSGFYRTDLGRIELPTYNGELDSIV